MRGEAINTLGTAQVRTQSQWDRLLHYGWQITPCSRHESKAGGSQGFVLLLYNPDHLCIRMPRLQTVAVMARRETLSPKDPDGASHSATDEDIDSSLNRSPRPDQEKAGKDELSQQVEVDVEPFKPRRVNRSNSIRLAREEAIHQLKVM